MSNSLHGPAAAQLGLWLPEPGDSLAQTLCKVYGLSMVDARLPDLLALHLKINPEIANAHKPLHRSVIYLASVPLHPGATLRGDTQRLALAKLNQDKPALAGSKVRLEAVAPRSPAEVEAMRFVLGFNEVMGTVGTGLGIGASTTETLAGRHLQADILKFNRWAQGKADLMKYGYGKDILHHFDARTDEVTRSIQKRLGPLERFLFNGHTVGDALNNGVPQSLRPNPITISAAERIRQVASGAKTAGIALAVVDAALTCQKLSATPKADKVGTAYREIGGFTGSLMTGAGVSIWIAASVTPVGWVGALVLSGVAAYGGKSIGEAIGSWTQGQFGDWMNLKDGRVLNQWCN